MKKKLGDVCEIELGKTPSRPNKSYWDVDKKTENVWLSIADLLNGNGKLVSDSKEYLSDEGAAISKIVKKGTLLVSFKLTLGRLAFAGRDLFTNEAIAALNINDENQISKDYLFHFLDHFDWNAATEGDVKIKGRTLNKQKLKELPIFYPESIPEQRRIVAILNEAFKGIATATASAEKNLNNARALFESTLQSVFANPNEGWVENLKPLADLCELIVDCEHKTAPTQEEGIPSIRTPNIGKGKLLLDGVYRVSEKTYSEWTRRSEPLPGDLILAREAPAGNVAVIPQNLKVCLGQRTVLIRPKRNVFEPEFLTLMLLQPKMQQKLLAHSRGATVHHVNMKDIRALNVGVIPSLPMQREIVSVVSKVTQDSEHLQSIYQQKLRLLTELKKSILNEAFSGRLH